MINFKSAQSQSFMALPPVIAKLYNRNAVKNNKCSIAVFDNDVSIIAFIHLFYALQQPSKEASPSEVAFTSSAS